MITGVPPVGGGVIKSPNRGPVAQAPRLIVEWTAELTRPAAGRAA